MSGSASGTPQPVVAASNEDADDERGLLPIAGPMQPTTAARPLSAGSTCSSGGGNKKKKRKNKKLAAAAKPVASRSASYGMEETQEGKARIQSGRSGIDSEEPVVQAGQASAPPVSNIEEPPGILTGEFQMASTPATGTPKMDIPVVHAAPVRIAVARDAAFCFYYHDNLSLLAEAGAQIVPFSPLNDALPLDIAGVYLGGGYPEHHAAELADNKLFRAGLKAFVDAGGVVYAECGGLLVLSQSIQPRGEPAQPMGEGEHVPTPC